MKQSCDLGLYKWHRIESFPLYVQTNLSCLVCWSVDPKADTETGRLQAKSEPFVLADEIPQVKSKLRWGGCRYSRVLPYFAWRYCIDTKTGTPNIDIWLNTWEYCEEEAANVRVNVSFYLCRQKPVSHFWPFITVNCCIIRNRLHVIANLTP